MILGTAGHIDHGKTALVRALTGVDTDRLPEEKKRGITIDLGFAPLQVDEVGTIGIVDVPGHEAFVRTMLAGASGIDIALLVIAADEGVMPQTREHLEILSLLGVTRGVIALTKRDLVDAEWLALQLDDVSALVADTPLASASVVPVSAKTGEGIDNLRRAIGGVARQVPMRRESDDLFRMPVDRAFTVKGTGTVVTGTVWSGEIKRDAHVIIRPGSRVVRVRGVEHHGQAANGARAGERTALALVGVEVDDVPRGSVVVSDPGWRETNEIEAMIRVNATDLRLTSRTRLHVHLGTSESTGRLSGLPDGTATRQVVDHRVRIHLVAPILARAGDRFVLRLPSPARTIGGGVVIDPYPDSRKIARRSRQPNRTDHTAASSTLASIIERAGAAGVELSALPIRTGLTPGEVVRQLALIGAMTSGTVVVSENSISDVSRRIEAAVIAEIANHSLDPGVSLQGVRSSVGAPASVVEIALGRLVEAGRLEVSGSLVRPAGWKPQLGEREGAVSEAILQGICKHPFEPPSVAELSQTFGISTVPLLRKLERDGLIERVSEDRYYSAGAVRGMVELMTSKLERGRAYSPGELRGVLGVSRKYLIPFLEFCDRRGITERKQDGRWMR